jgi:hypothetical protein
MKASPEGFKRTSGDNRGPAGAVFCFLLCVSLCSCDEPFPGYTEPENVLSGTVSVEAGDTVTVYEIKGGYSVSGALIMNVTVTNAHDDLLEGEAFVDGLVTVQSFSEIPRALTIPLTTGNLLAPPVFQGNVALAPGASAVFSTLWIPFATDGTIVFEGLPYVTVDGAKIYGPIDFLPSVDVQIFERVQPIQFEGEMFTIAFRVVPG